MTSASEAVQLPNAAPIEWKAGSSPQKPPFHSIARIEKIISATTGMIMS